MKPAHGIVLLALLLRLLRVPPRWSSTAWLYAAYPADTVDALRAGDLPGALAMTGLHPPLWPLLHALTELVAPVPLLWLLLSVLCSTAAVACLVRVSPLAALLLAVSPVQLSYAAEVNGYPLAVLLVAAACALRTGPTWALALVSVAAGWTHALAGLAVGLLALTLPAGRRWRVLAALALGALPLLPGLAGLLDASSTFKQPPFKPGLVLADLGSRFGWVWLALLPLAAIGATRRRDLLPVALGLPLAIGLLTALGVAAPHQFPYWLLLGPPLALLVAAGATHHATRAVAVVVVVLHGAVAVHAGLQRLAVLAGDEARAIDVAIDALASPWTCPADAPDPACSGDALVLIQRRVADDDDKRPLHPSMTRLKPWWPMPRVQPYAMDWGDYRHGQPRLAPLPGGPHVVYVDDHVREQLALPLAAHPRVWVVMPDTADDRPEVAAVTELVGHAPERVGADLLWGP